MRTIRPLTLPRRAFLASSLALAACHKPEQGAAPAASAKGVRTLVDAVAGRWRMPGDRTRDRWRHPAESLAFWGLKPGMTVLEFWPGTGWYTDIIAPFLAATHGKLYEANIDADDPAEPSARQAADAFAAKLKAAPRLYGEVVLTEFSARSGPVAPAGSCDLALFLRNLHNWMAAGIAEKAFHDAFAALKPGGVLGLEEHRAAPGGVQNALAPDGYVLEAYAIDLAAAAGFRLAGRSEINANPKDSRDHPFGVWTLPPTRLSAPRGQAPQPNFDHTRYDLIGESDRMTLKFVKPERPAD
ncbi:MAG: methyltransferase [Caulobacteraceae bacterium]